MAGFVLSVSSALAGVLAACRAGCFRQEGEGQKNTPIYIQKGGGTPGTREHLKPKPDKDYRRFFLCCSRVPGTFHVLYRGFYFWAVCFR